MKMFTKNKTVRNALFLAIINVLLTTVAQVSGSSVLI